MGDDLPRTGLVDGRYEITSELGRGAMGVVYAARDVDLDRPVALKVIAPEHAARADAVADFRREAMALARIRHPHVVQVHAFGKHLDNFFFAMEFVRGQNLDDIITQMAEHQQQMPLSRAISIIRDVGSGLGAVHAAGIIHRDIKPSNVVIEEGSGRPVLIDFGLARQGGATDNILAGSPPYMSPEHFLDGDGEHTLSAVSDIYSLGCAAFELLAGRPPFSSVTVEGYLAKHLHEVPPRISLLRPDLKPFDAVLETSLAKNPMQRFATCEAMLARLLAAQRAYDQQHPGQAPPAPLKDTVRTAQERGGKLRVLVVDDDPTFAKFAARAAQIALPKGQIDLQVAENGNAALGKVGTIMPDLVILDFDMPGLNGLETLSRLRALPSAERARVVVVSATVSAADRWQFSALGVRDFVRKPVSLPALIEAIGGLAKTAGWMPR